MATKVHLVRELREAANLSQEQLAVAIGVSSGTVRTWERGKEIFLSIPQWKSFAAAVKVEFDDLVTMFSDSKVA